MGKACRPLTRVTKTNVALKNDTEGTIIMTANGKVETITRKDPHEAFNGLGIYLAPDGNMHNLSTVSLRPKL